MVVGSPSPSHNLPPRFTHCCVGQSNAAANLPVGIPIVRPEAVFLFFSAWLELACLSQSPVKGGCVKKLVSHRCLETFIT